MTTTTTKSTPAKATAEKKAPARKRARRGADRPDMTVNLGPGDREIPLLGGEHGLPHVTTLPLDALGAHPRNVRFLVDDLDEMADSMREHGILERLLVAPTAAGAVKEPYTVIAGHRRKAAAALAGLTEVPVEIRYDLDTEQAQVAAMCVENIHRKDLTPVEEARAYQTLIDLGELDDRGIAKATGRTLATVRARLRLAQAPEPVQQAVHHRQASLADVELLWESEGDPTHADALAVFDGDVRDARFALQRAATIAKRRREAKSTLQAELDAGTPLVTVKEGWSSYSGPGPIGMRYATQDYSDDATCEHRGVVDDTDNEYQPSAVIVCMQPAKHRTGSGQGTLTDWEKEQRARAKEERRRDKEARETQAVATEIRRRHLRELHAAGGVATDKLGLLARFLGVAALQIQWDSQYSRERQQIRTLHDITGTDLSDVDAAALYDRYGAPRDQVDAWTDQLTSTGTPRATVLALAATVGETAIERSFSSAFGTVDHTGLSWLLVCRDHLGYELTEPEQQLLDASVAARDRDRDEDAQDDPVGVENVTGDTATEVLGAER